MTLETLITRPIDWKPSSESRYLFYTVMDGERFELRLNDFPEEPLCTLIGQGRGIDLEEFGEHWTMPWHRQSQQ